MNTVVRSLIITAVFDFHMTIMKKIPLWMLWFHVVRLVSASMYTCVNSQYYQQSENYILIQAADWAKQENRIRLVVWNRNSIDSKERQEIALIIVFYKDVFFLSHSDHVTTSNTELQWRMGWHIKPHLNNIIDEYPENQCSKKCRFACINNCQQEFSRNLKFFEQRRHCLKKESVLISVT